MKTKRFAKIATLVLAAALLICGVIGITTSAEENGATELSIAGKNVAYEGALKLVYYVDAPGFDAETQALKMNFWIGTKSETPAYVKEFEGDDNIVVRGGKTYYAFFSDDIAPVDMTKPVYAQPFIENADGTSVVCEEVTEYSVYTYAMNRFSQGPTADQLTLYKALLDYGAAVQAIFPEDANVDVYGWADAYYDITKYVFVDNTLKADKSLTRATPYRPSEIELDEDGKHLLALANSTLDGAYFKNITDEDGVPVDVQYVLPGTYTYNVNYTTAGTLTDYNSATDVNTLFIPNTSNTVAYQAWWSGYIQKLNERSESGTYMLFENGSLVTGTDGAKGNYGGWQIDINNGTNLPVEAGVTYVVAFDYKIVIKKVNEGNDGHLAWFGLNYSEDGYWSEGGKTTEGRGANIVNLDNYFVGDKTYINNSSATVPNGEWFNIRVEYEIVSLDNSATAENEAKANVRIYVDGVLAVNTVSERANSPESLLLYMRDSVGETEYYLDNLYVNSYAPSNMKGAGAYNNGSASSAANKVDAEGVADLNTVLSANGFEVNNKKADNALFVNEKGEIVAKTAGQAATVVIAGPDNSKNDGERGFKYIAELDMKITATDAEAGAVIGTLALYSDNAAQNMIASVDIIKNADGTASIGNITLNPNTWYNIRLEYKIEANGFQIDNAASFDGTLNAYVFTDLAYTTKIEGEVENRTFGSFGYTQGAANSSVTLDNFCFDYVALAGTKGNGAYYKQHVENIAKDIATAESFIDFTGKSITSAFKGVSTSNIHTTWKNSDKRWIMTTGADAMMFGGNVWSETTVKFPSEVTAAEGEKIVVEFDYLFEGADGGSGQYIEFNIMNGDTALIKYKFYNRSSGKGFWFSDNGWTINYLTGELNKWYNIRIEITYSASGSKAQVYIDNTKQGAAQNISADASTISGLKLTGRPAAGPNANSLFDNFVIDNTSTSKTSSYYGMYNNGEVTNAELVDMSGMTSIGQVLTNPSSYIHSMNTKPSTGSNSYAVLEDGTLTFGTLKWYSQINMVKEQTDLAVGTKYVMEYDFRFNGHETFVGASGKGHMLGRLGLLNGAGSTISYLDMYYTDAAGEKINLCFQNDANTFTSIKAGDWHKICMEVEVTETGCTITQKLDGNVVKTFTSTSSATAIKGFQGIIYEAVDGVHEYSFDNFVFAVIPPVAE